MDKKFLEEELIKIELLPVSWPTKFRLRILAGRASVDPTKRYHYYDAYKKAEENPPSMRKT